MDEEQLILRWHYQESCLTRNLLHLLESEVFTDVTLSVGHHSVKAHRLVLASCSSYFLQLFKGLEPSQHPIVILHDTSISDLKAIISFIYKGQCVVSKDHLTSLLSVAKTLRIQGLCDMRYPQEYTVDNEIENNLYESQGVSGVVNSSPNYEDMIEKDDSSSDENQFTESALDKEFPENASTEQLNSITKKFKEYIPKELLSTKKLNREVSENCKCFICGKYLSNQYNLRVHMETHNEAYHACQSCPHVSRSRDALRKHVSYRHPEEYNSRKRKKADVT